MTTIQEQIKLLQAIADGKTLQCCYKKTPTAGWRDAEPSWHDRVKQGFRSIDMQSYNWRIKPEPKVVWINEYPGNHTSVVHTTEASAKQSAAKDAVRVAVKYQEVL